MQSLAFSAIVAGALSTCSALLVAGFVVVHVSQNLWRPILISRLDGRREEISASTLLSIESQSRRLATMFLAPLLGAAVDALRSHGEMFSLLPVGAVGLLVGVFFLLLSRSLR